MIFKIPLFQGGKRQSHMEHDTLRWLRSKVQGIHQGRYQGSQGSHKSSAGLQVASGQPIQQKGTQWKTSTISITSDWTVLATKTQSLTRRVSGCFTTTFFESTLNKKNRYKKPCSETPPQVLPLPFPPKVSQKNTLQASDDPNGLDNSQ